MRFIKALNQHFKGFYLGFSISPMLIGSIPLPKNRKERREEIKINRGKFK